MAFHDETFQEVAEGKQTATIHLWIQCRRRKHVAIRRYLRQRRELAVVEKNISRLALLFKSFQFALMTDRED